MIARLKLTVGPLYIVTLIEILKVVKKIFVYEVILGKEIRIPDKLMINQTKDCSKDLPLSLQFYDYIYILIKKSIEEDVHKLAMTQLIKARQQYSTQINPFKSLDNKIKEEERADEPDDDQRKGITKFDRIS